MLISGAKTSVAFIIRRTPILGTIVEFAHPDPNRPKEWIKQINVIGYNNWDFETFVFGGSGKDWCASGWNIMTVFQTFFHTLTSLLWTPPWCENINGARRNFDAISAF